MARVAAALTLAAPTAGQLFALEGKFKRLLSPASAQLWKATPSLEGLQYEKVGAEHSRIVVKSSSTCLDSPSGVYYYIGGKSSDVAVNEYNLYGLSTATGEQVSQFELPTPNRSLMLSFEAMEWKMGCDQAGGVFLYGEWDGTDPDAPPQPRTLWRYDAKTQALESKAQIDGWAYGCHAQSFPAWTYNHAVAADQGLVSSILNRDGEEAAAWLMVIDTTSGEVKWEIKHDLESASVCAQVYDPTRKRFFGIASWFASTAPWEATPWTCWWDETTQPQKLVQVADYSDCGSLVATVDVAGRAGIFDIAGKLSTVSLDTGKILSQVEMPDGFYLFQQQQAAARESELVL